ncbi:TPA: hypothetical protein U2K06_002812 [Legionella pneumophila]|nr:hypothetical protein [Legionella pneumophila]
MSYKDIFKIYVSLFGLIYLLWAIATILILIIHANWGLGFAMPKFIETYVNHVYHLSYHPKDTPYLVFVLFVTGGTCLGIRLSFSELQRWGIL